MGIYILMSNISNIYQTCHWELREKLYPTCGDYVKAEQTIGRPRRNRCHFADDIFKCVSWNEKVWTSIKISLKFIPMGSINNIPALVQMMAWRRPGDKPLSEPMIIIFMTHICATSPKWVNVVFNVLLLCDSMYLFVEQCDIIDQATHISIREKGLSINIRRWSSSTTVAKHMSLYDIREFLFF